MTSPPRWGVAALLTVAVATLPSLAVPQTVNDAAAAAADRDLPTMPGAVIAAFDIAMVQDHLRDGRLTSEALVQTYLERIAALDDDGPTLNAVLALSPDALDQARLLDAERAAGHVRGPLHGIPILIKDNIEVAGLPTTAGSLALAGNATGRDAPLVARLRAAGAIILGKTNLSEWANIRSDNSTSGWSAVGGLTRNPHSLDRSACGSSAGSGAAVAASLAVAAIGTETDGSIVCPSGTNGIVGFKPTLGLVSRRFIVPISHSQDTAGPMTRSVRDAALILGVIAGRDPDDPATADADAHRADYAAALTANGLRSVRIGVMRDRVGSNPAILALLDRAVGVLRDQGATVVDIADSGIDNDALGAAEFAVLLTELKADMATYLAALPSLTGSGPTARSLADLIAFNTANPAELRWFGQETFVAAEATHGLDDPAYRTALATARRLAGAQGIDRLRDEHHVDLLLGVTNGPAWTMDLVNGDHFSGPGASQLPAVAGYPHLTVPMGGIEGLPIGLSFIGTRWDDAAVLRAGYAYEQASRARITPTYRARIDH